MRCSEQGRGSSLRSQLARDYQEQSLEGGLRICFQGCVENASPSWASLWEDLQVIRTSCLQLAEDG